MPALPATHCILLDIEGTTTPVDFVYKTLFPFARRHARKYVETHASDPAVTRDIEALRREHAADLKQGLNPPEWRSQSNSSQLGAAVTYIGWLMDHDRKSTALKSLQGRIWEEGYIRGVLRGEVYPDVPRAFERWHRQGKTIGIFSSGSVLAQKLLFGSSTHGDLTGFIKTYFDTTTGPKKEAASYGLLARALGFSPGEILFVSDVSSELDAARAAGMQTLLCIRAGMAGSRAEDAHRVIGSFDDIVM